MINIPLEIVIYHSIVLFLINITGYFFLRKIKKEIPENKSIKISANWFFAGIVFQIAILIIDIVYYFGITSLLKQHI